MTNTVTPVSNETNGLALGAFIASLIGFSVPAIVMGIFALKQVRRTGQKGDGFALAAIWIGAIGAVMQTVFIFVIIASVTASTGVH